MASPCSSSTSQGGLRVFFFFQAEDGIRDLTVTGVQTCALPISNNPSLGAFVVCYGPGPDALSIARIRAKGLGVYAENDARINAGLADVDAAIRTYHKSYRYTVYPGVGHGFLRAREKPEVADSAWKAVVGFILGVDA